MTSVTSIRLRNETGLKLLFASGLRGTTGERGVAGPPATDFVDITDTFSFVGDGVTDNSAAWNAFGAWAQAESAAGRAVHAHIRPGIYNADLSLCEYALQNIRRLILEGYGATLQ